MTNTQYQSTIEGFYPNLYVLNKRLIRCPRTNHIRIHCNSSMFLYIFSERDPRMYKSNFVAFLLFTISFSCYVIYVTKKTLNLHPVVLLSIMLITIIGIILFSDFYDTTYMKYMLLMGLFLYLILICNTLLNII